MLTNHQPAPCLPAATHQACFTYTRSALPCPLIPHPLHLPPFPRARTNLDERGAQLDQPLTQPHRQLALACTDTGGGHALCRMAVEGVECDFAGGATSAPDTSLPSTAWLPPVPALHVPPHAVLPLELAPLFTFAIGPLLVEHKVLEAKLDGKGPDLHRALWCGCVWEGRMRRGGLWQATMRGGGGRSMATVYCCLPEPTRLSAGGGNEQKNTFPRTPPPHARALPALALTPCAWQAPTWKTE